MTIDAPARQDFRDQRRRNWIALGLGALVAVPAYLFYGAGFLISDEGVAIDRDPLFLGVGLAPFAFVIVALVSRNARMSRGVLWAMAALLALGLSLGLLTPLLGASAGLGVGTALALGRPELPRVLRRRLVGVGLSVAYTLILLITITPAGVISGAIVPTLAIGLADDYSVWKAARDGPG